MYPAVPTGIDFRRNLSVLADLASSLNEDAGSIAPIATAVPFLSAGSTSGTKEWIELAVIHAFWRKANVSPQLTSGFLKAWPEISASLEEILCFRMSVGSEENDPFLLFSPIAAESIPVPAIDEYIDLVQNRFFIWRRPNIDRFSLGRALLSGTGPEAGDAFLDALHQLKVKPSYQSVSLGFTDGRTFFRNETRQNATQNSLGSSSSDHDHEGVSFEESYACKISINVSLAAREMKRRALGLDVVT